MRRLRSFTPTIPLLLLLLNFHLVASVPADAGETSVERVGKAVSGAVQSLSEKILNTTATNTTDDKFATVPPTMSSQGLAALEAAREAASKGTALGSHALCTPACSELSASLLSAVEGASCRSLFTTGKCPGGCMSQIAAITSNSSWASCQGCEGDLVDGAGERWAKLCGARQETLIDAGKEAVKTLVGDSFAQGFRKKSSTQLVLVALVLLLAAGYGWRKGRVMVLRIGKRRRGRKNSDMNIPV